MSGFYANNGTTSGINEYSNTFGVWGDTSADSGVIGTSDSGRGMDGQSTSGIGVYGESTSGDGVSGYSRSNVGVYAVGGGQYGTGVLAFGNYDAVIGWGTHLGGLFVSNVEVVGTLTKGTNLFKIDHPLDPANKYLFHSAVESPDMKNVYDGVVVLDERGEAIVHLPDWFEALNREFRYQLTPIGAPGPNLHIAEEISNQRFKIAGGTAAMRVSWQVTGIRQDAFAKANPLVVEQSKSADERGYYVHPEAHGQALDKSIVGARHPEILRRFMESQRKTP